MSSRIRDNQVEIQTKILELIEQAIIVTDIEGIVLYMNPFAEKLYRWKSREAVGQNVLEINVPEVSREQAGDIMNALKTGKSWRGESLVQRSDGTTFLADVIDTPIRDVLGNLNAIVGFSEDITARKRAEKRLETQMQHLAALRAIDTAITGSLDLRFTLHRVVEQTIVELSMDAASVLLLNPHTQTLTYAAGRGFRTRAIDQSRVRLGEGLAGKAILERQIVYMHNPSQSPDFTRTALLTGEGFMEYYAAPMTAKGNIVGVLEVFNRAPYEADEEWRIFFETLARQAAIAVDNARLFEDLQRSIMDLSLAYDATIKGWSRALDLRDKETEGHTQRVTELTERLARSMGISEAEIVHIRRGALLHDIGKMGVPDSILLKPDKLTDDEWKIMRQHPQFAFEMLSPIAYLRPAIDIPGCHHEKWDGTGYPRGLKGEQIPLAARLFAVVDVWDALRSDRPYRKAWLEEKILEHIRSLAGTHFDPKVVECFLKVTSEDTKGAG